MSDDKPIEATYDTREAPKPLVATGHVINVERVVGKHFYATLDNGLIRFGIMDSKFHDDALLDNTNSILMNASDSEFVDYVEEMLS